MAVHGVAKLFYDHFGRLEFRAPVLAKFNRGSVSPGLWSWNFLEVGEGILGKLRLLGRLLKRREESKWVGSLIDSRNNEKLGRNKNDGKDFEKSSELWIPDLRKYYHGNT